MVADVVLQNRVLADETVAEDLRDLLGQICAVVVHFHTAFFQSIPPEFVLCGWSPILDSLPSRRIHNNPRFCNLIIFDGLSHPLLMFPRTGARTLPGLIQNFLCGLFLLLHPGNSSFGLRYLFLNNGHFRQNRNQQILATRNRPEM